MPKINPLFVEIFESSAGICVFKMAIPKLKTSGDKDRIIEFCKLLNISPLPIHKKAINVACLLVLLQFL